MTRLRSHLLALLAAALPATALPGAAEAQQTVLMPLGGPVGVIRLSLPDPLSPAPFPVVVLLPDGPDAGNRADPIVDRLLDRGIAVVEVDADDEPDPAGLAEALEDTAPGWIAPGRIGVLGFGSGGRAALLWPGRGPVVVLYPACDGAPVPVVAAGALVLHADNAAERAACTSLPVRALPVPGATHAWDHRNGADEDAVARLPHPDGSGTRLTARRYPWAIEWVADTVASHFAAALLRPDAAGPVVSASGGAP
ncbi:hypothetical protein ACE7GA_25405 [Roseomonas sp. CCTCC AB2023176]|uniref:hypothetical protein n=1 Tax=Roseomonas sp. CCTCC AB2023176 TaxID=3342640 RepID=UPI0035E354EB